MLLWSHKVHGQYLFVKMGKLRLDNITERLNKCEDQKKFLDVHSTSFCCGHSSKNVQIYGKDLLRKVLKYIGALHQFKSRAIFTVLIAIRRYFIESWNEDFNPDVIATIASCFRLPLLLNTTNLIKYHKELS